MKHFLLASLLSLFLMPHFSYAAENISLQSHHVAHRSANAKSQYTQPVDVNHADDAQLMTLKGIGPKRASEIVSYRQAHGVFKTVNELAQVHGLGVKGLARLQRDNPGRITINTGGKLK